MNTLWSKYFLINYELDKNSLENIDLKLGYYQKNLINLIHFLKVNTASGRFCFRKYINIGQILLTKIQSQTRNENFNDESKRENKQEDLIDDKTVSKFLFRDLFVSFSVLSIFTLLIDLWSKKLLLNGSFLMNFKTIINTINTEFMTSYIIWLMNCPAGLKLNSQLSNFFGSIILLYTEHWNNLILRALDFLMNLGNNQLIFPFHFITLFMYTISVVILFSLCYPFFMNPKKSNNSKDKKSQYYQNQIKSSENIASSCLALFFFHSVFFINCICSTGFWISLFYDSLGLCFLHFIYFYYILARIYQIFAWTMLGLWRLFRGQTFNMKKKRISFSPSTFFLSRPWSPSSQIPNTPSLKTTPKTIVSDQSSSGHDISPPSYLRETQRLQTLSGDNQNRPSILNQQIVGTLLFSISFFLFPTVSVFYVFLFTIFLVFVFIRIVFRFIFYLLTEYPYLCFHFFVYDSFAVPKDNSFDFLHDRKPLFSISLFKRDKQFFLETERSIQEIGKRNVVFSYFTNKNHFHSPDKGGFGGYNLNYVSIGHIVQCLLKGNFLPFPV